MSWKFSKPKPKPKLADPTQPEQQKIDPSQPWSENFDPDPSLTQRDDINKVLISLQAVLKNFRVSLPVRIQLLTFFAIGKRLDFYHKNLVVYWPSFIYSNSDLFTATILVETKSWPNCMVLYREFDPRDWKSVVQSRTPSFDPGLVKNIKRAQFPAKKGVSGIFWHFLGETGQNLNIFRSWGSHSINQWLFVSWLKSGLVWLSLGETAPFSSSQTALSLLEKGPDPTCPPRILFTCSI